jgi:hypothetical protein
MMDCMEGRIMRKATLLLSSTLLLALLGSSAQAHTMRCDRDLISRGDNQGEVLAACGEPLIASHRTNYRSGIPTSRFRSLSLGNGYRTDITSRELIHHNRSIVEVPVKVWTYNFGPRAFMREVTFVDGRVNSIRTLGYGH